LKNLIILSLIFINLEVVTAQHSVDTISNSEASLVSNWESSNLKDLPSFKHFSLTTASSSDINAFYSEHKTALSKKIKDRDSNKKKAETIFKYLHDEVFLRYNLESGVKDLAESNLYNCVTATSFFVSMAEEFGVPYQIYETPAHVYASITHKNKEIIVELTAPEDGFDFGSTMETLLQTLVDNKLISRDELAEKGPEVLFNEYVAETIPISKKQLLAIQYHNDALIKADKNQFQDAYNQLNKAILLYPNATFSNAYKYIVSISQLEFTLKASEKYTLLKSLLISTKNDSVLSYTLINHLGELIEDLLKFEENFELTAELLANVEANVFRDEFIDNNLKNYYVYMYTVFAQSASLKGEALKAKNNIEKAHQLDPENTRLTTYYISVTSTYSSKLSQLGLFETARSTIEKLASKYPEGYPIIDETRVQIILDALVPVQLILENKSKLVSELELAHSIQPDNIYLKSFSATVFHELAMHQIRRSEYQEAKKLILQGLDYNSDDATLKSDLDLINEILE